MTASFVSKYKILQKIGEGSFSEVLKCESKETGNAIAAKRLKKNFKSINEVMNCAEIIAMQKVSWHPNILYMIEFHYDPLSGKLVFIFEMMDMSMYEFMKLRKKCIAELKVKNYLYQILKGLDHLHKNGLFHRDVKPENILVKLPTQYNSPWYPPNCEMVKIADLGSVRGIYSKPPYTEYISTRWYRSPECLLTVGYYGSKMDVWAAGCVFYEMLMLKPLFPGINEIDQLAKIHSIFGTPNYRLLNKFKKRSRNYENFPKQSGLGLTPLLTGISIEGQEVLKLMINYDPETRINLRRLLDHKYFRSLREDNANSANHIKPELGLNINSYSKNSGDFRFHPLLNYFASNDRWRSSKYRTISRDGSDRKKPKQNNSFNSKTTSDVYNMNVSSKPKVVRTGPVPLVGQSEIKSWGVNPNMLKSKVMKHEQIPAKIKQYSQRRMQKPPIFRKTTSNLPQVNNTIEDMKSKQFQSKSFVLPYRSFGRAKLGIFEDLKDVKKENIKKI